MYHFVISIFPNKAVCLRLISAILVEIDEAWQTGKKYLSFPPSAKHFP
jgi:putative transposase